MIAFLYTCDSCGKKGQGSVRGLTAVLLPPDGWKWCFHGPLWGPHACSLECWDKVKLSPNGKLYLDWDHESKAGKADWQQPKTAAPATVAAPPPPKVKAQRKHQALDGRVAALEQRR